MTSDEKGRVYDAISAVIKKADEERADMGEALAGNNHDATVALFMVRFSAVLNALSVFTAGAFGLFLIIAALNDKVSCLGEAFGVTEALAAGTCLTVVLILIYLMNVRLFSYRVTAKTVRAFLTACLLFCTSLAASVIVTLFSKETITIALAFLIAPVLGICYNFMALVHWPSYKEWFDATVGKLLK